MTRRYRRPLSFSFLIMAVVALPLTGCGTGGFGGLSSYGANTLSVAEISDIEAYPADRALAEARGHFRNDNFGHSAALYKRVVELSPKNPEGYVGLGASYDRLGRFDLSDRVYAALFQLSGGTTQYYNNLGYSLMLRGKLGEALTNFRQAERLDPGNVVVANNLQILARAAAQARA